MNLISVYGVDERDEGKLIASIYGKRENSCSIYGKRTERWFIVYVYGLG